MRVVTLAGGTGGAKLAAGLQALLGEDLAVIANTGDDVEALGVYVAPDPDLVTYWLCDEIDEDRGWGIRDDSFTVFERLKKLGAPDWFGLTDRDLATCLYRAVRLSEGARLTEAQGEIAAALGARASVLPMTDSPVRTRVRTEKGWRGFQEYLVRERAEPAVLEVAFDGIEDARPPPEALAALERADAVVVGPSNPVISIGPILSVPGMRAALEAAPGPVVAVSPYVRGEVVKGPTEKFMRAAGVDSSTEGMVALYGDLLDGVVIDAAEPRPPGSLPIQELPTLMSDSDSRRSVAAAALELAAALRRS